MLFMGLGFSYFQPLQFLQYLSRILHQSYPIAPQDVLALPRSYSPLLCSYTSGKNDSFFRIKCISFPTPEVASFLLTEGMHRHSFVVELFRLASPTCTTISSNSSLQVVAPFRFTSPVYLIIIREL